MKALNAFKFKLPAIILIVSLFAVTFFVGRSVVPTKAYSGSYALNFNGTDELVEIGPEGSVQEILGANWKSTKSLSVWVRPLGVPRSGNSTAELDPIVTSETKFFGITRGLLQVSPGVYQDGIYIWNFDGIENRVRIPYTGGEWVHITMVHSGGTLYAYKNGVLIGTTPSGDTNTFRDDLQMAFGGSQFGGQIPKFQGQVDEVAMWSTALTQGVIRDWLYREIDSSHPNWADLGAYYKMSDGTGATVTDNSAGPSNHPGTLVGTPDWVHSGAFSGPRNALNFDGVDDTVVISDHSSLDLSSGLTFEAWVNPGDWSNGSATPLAVKGDGIIPAINYYFGKSSTDAMQFSYYNGGRVDVVDTSGASFSNGTWYHLAYVVDVANNKIGFYRNGSLLGEVSQDFTSTPLLTNNQDLLLARYLNGADLPFQGQLDEVRLWNDVRTIDEIRMNMFQTLVGDESGLVAYYRFDQDNHATQTTLYDSTTNHNDGTLAAMVPTADWVASSAFNTWIGGDSTQWTASGNWSRYTVPVASDNVGVYSDTGENTLSITSTVSTSNLVVGTGALLSVESSGSLSLSDSVFNFGTMRQTLAASGTSDIAFLDVSNYGGVALNPNGTDLGNVTVSIQGTQQCTGTVGDTVTRCFDITSDNPPASGAQIAFYFWDTEDPNNDCTHTEAFHWNGVGWDILARDTTTAPWVNGRICGSMLQSIRVEGVTTFSPFALDNTSPTAVTMLEFTGSSLNSDSAMFLLGALIFSVSLLLWLRFRYVRTEG